MSRSYKQDIILRMSKTIKKNLGGYVKPEIYELFQQLKKRFPLLNQTQIIEVAIISLYNTQLVSNDPRLIKPLTKKEKIYIMEK